MLPSLLQAVTDIRQQLFTYVEGYSQYVDLSQDFHLLTEEYSNLGTEITKAHSSASETAAALSKVLGSIDDLVDTDATRSVVTASAATRDELVDKLQKTITTQEKNWSTYEADMDQLVAGAVELIQQAVKVIGAYSGKTKVAMANYTPGSFENSELGATLLATVQGVKSFDASRKKAVQRAQKVIDTQWSNHVKLIKARKEAIKQQGRINLWVEAAFFVAGAAITIATCGTGLGVVACIGASAIFPAFRIAADKEQMDTGVVKDDLLMQEFKHGFGKNGETMYQVADFATNVLSDAGAMKSFAEKGFKTAAMADVKSMAKDTAKDSLKMVATTEKKTAAKQFIKDGVALKDGVKANLKHTSFGIASGMKTSASSYSEKAATNAAQSAIKKNVLTNMKQYAPKVYEKAVQQGTVRRIAKESFKASVRNTKIAASVATAKSVLPAAGAAYGESFRKEAVKKSLEPVFEHMYGADSSHQSATQQIVRKESSKQMANGFNHLYQIAGQASSVIEP